MMAEVITPNWELKTELQSTRAAFLSLQEEHKILLEKQSVLKMMFTDVTKKKQIPKKAITDLRIRCVRRNKRISISHDFQKKKCHFV